MRSLRCDRVTRGKVNYFISCETIDNVRSIHIINAMDAASSELADLDGLSNAELKALLQEKHAQLVVKDAEILSYTAEIESLKLLIRKLRLMQYGKRSEQRAHQIEQLELLVENLETAAADRSCVVAQHSATKPAASVPKPRREVPPHLPRETQTIAPQQSCCPDCGGELKHLGEDVSEILEREPVRHKVIRVVRPKLACASCDKIVQAPAPTRPIERGMAGSGLLAHVLVSKYGDHLPLYRQAEIFAREGLELDRTLLAQWVGNVTALLIPLTDALRTHVFAAVVVHADDTPLPVLAPGRGKTKTGRLWTYVRDERPAAGEIAPAVWFAYSPDRKGEHPQQHLANFRGILQADAYAGFSKIYDSGLVFEAACWAHARRKFYDLYVDDRSPMATEALQRIAALYAIEREIRGSVPSKRAMVRQERAGPLLAQLHGWLTAMLQR